MFISQFTFINEDISHAIAIENINAEAFGPGRHARAAARIREQGPHDKSLSFVCLDGSDIVGSVRMTPVWIGELAGYLLGPLAVRPSHKKKGIGNKLIQLAVNSVKGEVTILVGDLAYYGSSGFSVVENQRVEFPGPVDKSRILAKRPKTQSETPLSGLIKFRSI